jgi:hypothetical protein
LGCPYDSWLFEIVEQLEGIAHALKIIDELDKAEEELEELEAVVGGRRR